MATAYAEHPLTKAEKAELKKKFDKIVDVRFAPEKLEDGDKIIKKSKPKAKRKAEPKNKEPENKSDSKDEDPKE